MPKNIEIKAKLDDIGQAHRIAESISTSSCETIVQSDTFFKIPSGRLKLRDFKDGSGLLIFYEREDSIDPVSSYYRTTPTTDVEGLRKVLMDSLGIIGEVKKKRYLYLCGRTRIHLDEVENLGNYLELEVVMEEGESEATGIDEATDIMQKLSINKDQLVHCAYIDLLAAQV